MSMEKQFKIFQISELKPHPRNQTIYGDEESDDTFSELVQLIRKHGLRTKIIVNENGTIISGHRRFRALQKLGYSETECEVRHYDNDMEELRDLVVCNSGRRQKTRVQQLREGEAIYEVESWKASIRQKAVLNNSLVTEQSSLTREDEKGETRDIVAKIINWGSGAKSSGKDYSLGRSALKESDRLRKEGNTDLADIIVTQINKRGAHAAYDLAFKVDIDKLNDVTMAGLRSGQISGRANTLPLKPEYDKSPKREDDTKKVITTFTKNENTIITRADLEETVQEYNAQSRGEIEITIPQMEKGYVSKTIESAMRDFKNKVAQCMTHQREIINLSDEEKARLNKIMTKFIEDFEKDKKYITGGM